jgi:hypothetical protein
MCGFEKLERVDCRHRNPLREDENARPQLNTFAANSPRGARTFDAGIAAEFHRGNR